MDTNETGVEALSTSEVANRARRIDTRSMLLDRKPVPMHQYVAALEESHDELLRIVGVGASEGLTDISESVEALRANHEDDEMAHSDADSIMVRALEFIASGCVEPGAVARKALEVEEIDFNRWYA